MLTIVSVVVLLGVLILAHEWGHFIVAKSFGVRVDVFSIGFGPRIWGWKSGPTDYRLSILPLGGYVKMAGDNPIEERTGAPDEFLSKPRWQRAIIALAGPAMNVVLAVLLLIGLYALVGVPYAKYLSQPVEVVGFSPEADHSPKGLQVGDRLVEIGNLRNPNWEQAFRAVRATPAGEELSAVVERGGEAVNLVLLVREPANPTKVLGYLPQPAVIDVVVKGNPADRAGMKEGDRVLSVNGTPVPAWEEFTRLIRSSKGERLTVVVDRDGKQIALEIQPEPRPSEDGSRTYLIGVLPRVEVEYRSVAFSEAVRQSVAFNWGSTQRIGAFLAGLVRGQVSIRELGGPVEIARQSGRAADEGMAIYINLMAFISLNLAILNLLPIPILDGGHILMLAIEGGMRRDLSLRVKERFVQVGFVFLILIFAVVMYNDILRSFL